MEGVGGHQSAVQVHRFQQFGEMAGLVVLDVHHLEVIQQPAAVLGDAEKMTRVPSARRAPQEVLPSTTTATATSTATATALNRLRAQHRQ